MYLILKHNQLFSVLFSDLSVYGQIDSLRESFLRDFNSHQSNVRYYTCFENYFARSMQNVKILHVDNPSDVANLDWVPFFGRDNRYNQRGWIDAPESVLDWTSRFFRTEPYRYEATTKVFATVTKRGIKSSGMEVILDPELLSESIRPVEYYENLVGTFARIKATTNIHDYGWATLFLSPDSIGNIRLETQLIDGFRFVTL